MSSLYVPESGGHRATDFTRGPWDTSFQHAGPPAALLAREAERVSGIPSGQFARLGFDILRPIPVDVVVVAARVLRPGRRVELVEAELTTADSDEVLMRLTAWRIRRERVELPEEVPASDPPPPGPEGAAPAPLPFWAEDVVAYGKAFEWRVVSGILTESSPACVWARMQVDLVAGEPARPLDALIVMGDAASGVSAALPWKEFVFPNVDYGLHLEREPEGEWLAMDARTRPGPEGVAQCTSVLSDTRGRVGIATQSLLVARR